MSDRIDWDYVNQMASHYVNQELSEPFYDVPRLEFASSLNKFRMFLSSDDALIGCNEGLVTEVHGYFVQLDEESCHLLFVAGDERARYIRAQAHLLLSQGGQTDLTFWPVPSVN